MAGGVTVVPLRFQAVNLERYERFITSIENFGRGTVELRLPVAIEALQAVSLSFCSDLEVASRRMIVHAGNLLAKHEGVGSRSNHGSGVR